LGGSWRNLASPAKGRYIARWNATRRWYSSRSSRNIARREKADIYFGDAAHMRSDHHAGRTWGKKGETPVVL
jgi:hypothetical protein